MRHNTRLARLTAAAGGFLLAVLWFDLMFDVQVLASGVASGPLPEATIASIAAYYRRVTTDASPMSRLVGLAMIVAIGGSAWQLVRGYVRRRAGVAMLVLVTAPCLLAAVRVFPNAARLGARLDTIEQQSELARAICTDHLMCLAAITVFVVLQCTATQATPRS